MIKRSILEANPSLLDHSFSMFQTTETPQKIRCNLILGINVYARFMRIDSLGPSRKIRMRIRERLIEDLNHTVDENIKAHLWPKDWPENLRQLGTRPLLPHTTISISHCPSTAGFLFSTEPGVALGLDIEEVHRIHRSVEYISTEEEIKQAPQRSLLWVAKEAVFKSIPQPNCSALPLKDFPYGKAALPPKQSNKFTTAEKETPRPYFLSDSLIFDWENIGEEGYYRFNFSVKKKRVEGSGIAYLTEGLAIGYAHSQI